MERRVLYNLLKMNWMINPSQSVLPWQVQDYRQLSNAELFQHLENIGIFLDRVSFTSLTDQYDSPEELTDQLLIANNIHNENSDHVYLLIFEMWRRFVPEKLSLSMFCDELDYQITKYENGEVNEENLQDTIANFAMILDENTDHGLKPQEAFAAINASCAHDLESFLYNFIAEQIDIDNLAYASELIDDFTHYITEKKWFNLLKMRILLLKEEEVGDLSKKNFKEAIGGKDINFNLELLSIFNEIHDQSSFITLAKQTIPLINTEEELHDFGTIAIEFFNSIDQSTPENELKQLLKDRVSLEPSQHIEKKNEVTEKLNKIFQINPSAKS